MSKVPKKKAIKQGGIDIKITHKNKNEGLAADIVPVAAATVIVPGSVIDREIQ